jgi:hypothetical protein
MNIRPIIRTLSALENLKNVRELRPFLAHGAR